MIEGLTRHFSLDVVDNVDDDYIGGGREKGGLWGIIGR